MEERSRFSILWFLFSFEGRIGRMPYWVYTVCLIVLLVAGLIVFGAVADAASGSAKVPKNPSGEPSVGILLLVAVLFVVYSWTNYAVLAKRWHDRDKSGWWSMIGLIPYVGGIWILVECGFLKGTSGPNRFGHDPDDRHLAEVFE